MARVFMQLQILLLLTFAAGACVETKNGFNLTGALVPEDEIHSGGPPRDGIPAIDNPRFVNANLADFLQPGDRVIGIARNGASKAYPVAILNWHEIVNDRIGDEPVVVSYCPLCGTGIVYQASAGGRPWSLGSQDCSTTAICCSMTARPAHCGRRSVGRRSAAP